MCHVIQDDYILVAVKFLFHLAEIFESIFHSAEEIWNFKMDDYTTVAMVFYFSNYLITPIHVSYSNTIYLYDTRDDSCIVGLHTY